MTEAMTILQSCLVLAAPLILSAMGGYTSERSGVINIALEGLLLAGAFTAAVVTYETSNPYIGFVAAMAAGAFVAAMPVENGFEVGQCGHGGSKG